MVELDLNLAVCLGYTFSHGIALGKLSGLCPGIINSQNYVWDHVNEAKWG